MTAVEFTLLLSELVDVARSVREHAYAPYSAFRVGAALRTVSGRIFSGCNVENATYGATICAERSAVVQMVSAGERQIQAIAVFTDAEELAMPCGICRQFLVEFSTDITVVVANPGGARLTTLSELLPQPFILKR